MSRSFRRALFAAHPPVAPLLLEVSTIPAESRRSQYSRYGSEPNTDERYNNPPGTRRYYNSFLLTNTDPIGFAKSMVRDEPRSYIVLPLSTKMRIIVASSWIYSVVYLMHWRNRKLALTANCWSRSCLPGSSIKSTRCIFPDTCAYNKTVADVPWVSWITRATWGGVLRTVGLLFNLPDQTKLQGHPRNRAVSDMQWRIAWPQGLRWILARIVPRYNPT
jgi:hypothetical protein